MPSNLSPELLALLQSSQVGNGGSYIGPQYGTSHYAPITGPGQWSGGENGEWQPGPVTGYYSAENGQSKKGADQYNGADRNEYDAQGNYVKTDKWSGLKGTQELMPLMMLAAPLAMAAMGVGAVGAGAAGAAGGGAAGAVGSVAGDAFLPGILGAGGSEVAMGSLIPGLEAYAAPALAGGAGSVAGASSGATGTLPAVEVPTWSASEFAGSQPFNWSPTAGGGAASLASGGGGGVTGPFQPPAPGGGGLFSSLGGAGGLGSTLSSLSGLAGPAAALLGAAAGAEGTPGTESSTTKDLPEWLKPRVNKGLDYAGSLLDKQMAPGYLSGYDVMRDKGMGLLNTPQRGNAFSQFFPQYKF